LEVAAKSAFASAKASTKVIVEECYLAALRISPPEIEICAGQSGSVLVRTQNIGTLESGYKLSADAPSGIYAAFDLASFKLNSGESKESKLQFEVIQGTKAGTYDIEVKSMGLNQEESAIIKLAVPDVAKCHALRLVPDSTIKQTGAGIGKSFRIMVINEGRFVEKVELFLKNNPAWTYITPNRLEIQPGKKEEALVYFAPPLNEKLKVFPMILEVSGKYLSKDLDLRVEVVAIDEGREVKIDLTDAKIPARFELDTETPIKIVVKNSGVFDITNASVLFSQGLGIVKQQPTNIDSGESKEIQMTLEPQGVEPGKIKFKLGVYSVEGFAERDVETEIIGPLLEIVQAGSEFERENQTVKVKIKLANRGNETLKIRPQALQDTQFSVGEITLAAGEEKEIEAVLKEGSETLYFEDLISGKVYRKRIKVDDSGGITGLFTASLSRLLPFLIAIIAGIFVLYVVLKGRKKPPSAEEPKFFEEQGEKPMEEYIDSKKNESQEGKENKPADEPEIQDLESPEIENEGEEQPSAGNDVFSGVKAPAKGKQKKTKTAKSKGSKATKASKSKRKNN
jgi:uncharacterized membrane protein